MLWAVALEHPDYIFHLGDMLRDSLALAREYPDIPMVSVAGNCDGQVSVPAQRTVELAGKRFFLTHGHPYSVKLGRSDLMAAAREQGADAVFFGHTHQAYCQKENSLWVMNPGSVGAHLAGSYGVVWLEGGQMGCYTTPADGGTLIWRENGN